MYKKILVPVAFDHGQRGYDAVKAARALADDSAEIILLNVLPSSGSTLGKKVFGLRVVNEAGGGITVGASMVRNIIRVFELFLPFFPLLFFECLKALFI